MINYLLNGFSEEMEKIAGIKDITKRIFGTVFNKKVKIRQFKQLPRVNFISGKKSDVENKMLELIIAQGLSGKLINWVDKQSPGYKKELFNYFKRDGFAKGVLGTWSYGKSGAKESFVDISRVKELKKDPDTIKRFGKELTRTVVAHEKFHTLPIVGQSETLAHIAGGLAPKKNKLSNAVKQYRHVWETRPGRVGLEHALAGGATYGTYRGAKHFTKKENK